MFSRIITFMTSVSHILVHFVCDACYTINIRIESSPCSPRRFVYASSFANFRECIYYELAEQAVLLNVLSFFPFPPLDCARRVHQTPLYTFIFTLLCIFVDLTERPVLGLEMLKLHRFFQCFSHESRCIATVRYVTFLSSSIVPRIQHCNEAMHHCVIEHGKEGYCKIQ